MPEFAEIIYETGTKSVVSVDNREDMLEGLKEQHNRALNGQVGGPTGHPAERIKRVLIYDDHPGNLNPDATLSSDEIKQHVNELLKASGDVINLNELASQIRDISNAHVPTEHPHDSQYKMEPKETIDFSSQMGGEN